MGVVGGVVVLRNYENRLITTLETDSYNRK